MRYYFRLQYKMLNRHISDFGLHPLTGYLISTAGFAALSIYLFSKTEFADYIYITIAISLILKLCESTRNEFLKSCFTSGMFHKIRFSENIIVILPFLIFLIYRQSYTPLLLLLVSANLLAFLNLSSQFQFTIPTPFFKRPFEFITGFRKTFYIFFLAYIFTIIAVSVANFNLGIFSLILVFLISLSFYTEPEKEYFVWIHNLSPERFLLNKIRTALLFSTYLSLPIIVAMGIFFFINIKIIFVFQALGYAMLTTIILAKYSAYPGKINIPQTALLALCLYLPAFLIGIIPYFYLQSIKRLKEYLE